MVYSLGYRRPERIERTASSASLSGAEKRKSIDRSIRSYRSGMSHGIPEALSFDRIISGGTCPPCTTRDFMNYLKYIELAAENLQFHLWFRSYCRRFNELPEAEKGLSPIWIKEHNESETPVCNNMFKPEVAAIFKGTDFASNPKVREVSKEKDPFSTPPRTPNSEGIREAGESFDFSYGISMTSQSKDAHAQRATAAFENAGLKWMPLTVQPYREEVTRIISIYIADGGSRQLNLSSKERTKLLHALQNTTHPSAFHDVANTVEWSLRCQAHPNFIRWTICNGNRPRVIFARGLGVAGIVGGLIAAVLITLSSAGRAWRVLSVIGFLIGISTLIAAWKGMCVVLHGMHHRHLRPWELFASDDEPVSFDLKSNSVETLSGQDSSNSYENEPWVAKYEKRNIIRKVFDREVWIQEPALRQIQDTIFLQAILGSAVLSFIIVGIFCAFPHGGFY